MYTTMENRQKWNDIDICMEYDVPLIFHSHQTNDQQSACNDLHVLLYREDRGRDCEQQTNVFVWNQIINEQLNYTSLSYMVKYFHVLKKKKLNIQMKVLRLRKTKQCTRWPRSCRGWWENVAFYDEWHDSSGVSRISDISWCVWVSSTSTSLHTVVRSTKTCWLSQS